MNKYERKPEYILDLHGKTTKEAKEILDELLELNRHNHIRVITGKATFRETGPVMKNFVAGYLRTKEIKFETSKLHDGGEGAMEVYMEGNE